MRFVELNSETGERSSVVRNPWNWIWLEEKCDLGKPFKLWCKKISDHGKCFCVVCSTIITYGSSGKKALRDHANNRSHIQKSKCVDTSSKLSSGSTYTPESDTCHSFHDQKSEIKCVVGLFMAEHSIPFSLADDLVALCKRVSSNPTALNSVSFSRTSATYCLTHGVASAIKKSISEKLQGQYFSLNIDEATNEAGNKILNILVQYFDEDEDMCVIDLLGSREVNCATSVKLKEAVESVLKERSLSWTQVVSVLMDNCAVMRGSKSGLEKRIRDENPNVLDISGDTVHMVNIAANKLFGPMEKDFFSFSGFASDVYYDIEDSPKMRFLFSQIQSILFNGKKSIFRPITTRFLQLKQVAERLYELWDALLLYYSTFLKKNENAQKKIIDRVVQKYNLPADKQLSLNGMLQDLAKHVKTVAGVERSDKIINALIDNEERTLILVTLHISLLEKFEAFVKSFQTTKPICHEIHTSLFRLYKSFCACFIIPEEIPIYSTKDIIKLDTTDKSIQVKDRKLFVGSKCQPILMRCLRDSAKFHWMPKFFSSLREGYIKASVALKKLPLCNPTLSKMAYLDPSHQRSELTSSALMSLAENLPNVIPEDQLGGLDAELREYGIDEEITMFDADSNDKDFRLDRNWWSLIFKMKHKGTYRYPLLIKLVKALITIFCGPVVEGSFNIMHDIVTDDRSRLTVHNYEALTIVKNFLNARNLHATSMQISNQMIKEVAQSFSNYKSYLTERPSTSSCSQSICDNDKGMSQQQQTSLDKQQSEDQPSVETNASPKVNLSLKRKQASLSSFFSKKPRI